MRRLFLLFALFLALLIPAESVAGPFMVLHKRGSAWSVPAVADPSVEQSAKATAQATSITVTFSSAPANNSVVVVFMEISDYPSPRTITPPDGFVAIEDTTNNSAHFASFYKVCGASEPTEYTFSISGTADYCSIVAYEVSGADTVNPIYASSETTASAATITISEQAGYENGLVLAAAGSEMYPTSLDQPTVSTGWTVDQYAKPTYHSCAGASRNTTTSPVSIITFTYSASSNLLAHIVAIKPASAGTELAWIQKQSAASADNRQWSVAASALESTYVTVGKYTTYDWNYFIRFTDVSIAKDATIVSAKLEVHALEDQANDTCNGIISGVDADNPDAPGTIGACEALVLTTASVAWSAIDHWTINTWYDSPDIAAIIQEIVNRDGWVSGNAMIAVVKDNASSVNAYRTGKTHPDANRVKLTIVYEK